MCGQVWAVLDPLSRAAQRAAPLLEFLEQTLQPSIQACLPADIR